MKGKQGVILLALCICIAADAQKPELLLSNWSSTSSIEKAYLHLDRDNYIAGETAWFKAYLYSDYLPDTISTSLYVELVNDSGKVHNRSIVPVLLGSANGHIELPDSLITGSYIIRAYSPTMLNQEASFIFRRSIFIYGKKNNTPVSTKEKMIRLEFFPEGGNFISGFNNTLAFKASGENGLPITVKGNVLNEKSEVVTTFNSLHDGMGMFELTPASNQKYYVLIDGDEAAKKYYLPEQTDKGIALTVIPHPQGNFFEIKQRKDDPSFQAAYMVGQMQHHVVFKQEFKNAKEEIQGVINTQKLHSGILQITFFNKDDQPLAERLCFVDNKEYIQRGELIADTINFNEKGRNRFSIQLKDTVQGSFSISITDPEYSLLDKREENIFSNLLLTSDLKGYIHNPAYYFSVDNDSVKTSLDLVMMTNGWRRFKWTELAQRTMPVYKDGSFITLSGKATLRDVKKPFAEKPLLLMLVTQDSTRSLQMITTDKSGNFRLDSMLFFGRSQLFFNDIRGKKSQYIDVHISADSLTKPLSFPLISVQPYVFATASAIANGSKIDLDYDAIMNAKGVMLEGVTVKAKRKTPIEVLEEKYTTGAFSGEARKVIDLLSTDESLYYTSIWDLLRAKGHSPGSRNMPTISALGEFVTDYFLNEIQVGEDVISMLPMKEIAMIRVYSSFAGAWGNSPGGTIAVYTKKGEDIWDTQSSFGRVVPYHGYSVTKEFYEPDYKVDKSAKAQTDNRITLAWRPNILINNVNPKIPITFYNNDRTKSFKIVVEGMTIDGKMLLIEKTITRKGF